MSTMEMKLFRHKVTGKTDYFPEHFVEYDYMELVDNSEIPCCGGDEPAFLAPELVADEDEYEYDYEMEEDVDSE